MKQILWIGCLESDEEFKIKAGKGYNLASAQVSQRNLIRGLEQVTGLTIDSINGSVLPPYPEYADRFIKPVRWSHARGAADVSVGFTNDKYINRLNCKRAMIREAESWVRTRYQGGELVVMVYSMRSGPMAAACRIRELVPSAKLYLIVSDLPQFMDLNQSRIKAALKKIDWMSIRRMQRCFDGFVLYARKMARFLKIPDSKWLLMEGSYDADELDQTPQKRERAILYSGKLDRAYGIGMLLEAFMGLRDEELQLWLTGGGNAEALVRNCEKEDPRIHFFGFLPSREDVLALQQRAALLVNMRLPSEPASAYSFPSKLFEYMATGVPVLSFRLEGIPSEYEKHLCMIDEESVEGVRNALREYLDAPEEMMREKGAGAAAFIRDHKNCSLQCLRICRFIGLNTVEVEK